MSMIFFTYRAPMEARRGAAILSSAGIPGKLSKTPSALSVNGCGKCKFFGVPLIRGIVGFVESLVTVYGYLMEMCIRDRL